MKGYELRFNVYADSQEEADKAATAIKQFISDMAGNGIAVSANKIAEAVTKWKNNFLVTNYFK
jgi:L-lactate utilization protein LutC